jgi:hypothetical protein
MKTKRKPSLRNLKPNTYDENKPSENRYSKGSRFGRLKTDSSHHKNLNHEKSCSEVQTKELVDKQIEKPQNQRFYRKPHRTSTLLISAQNNYIKDQERKLE